MKPIIKWQGGKTQLISEITKRVPKSYNVYYEPFAGSLAVLLFIKPDKAIINDINTELITLYRVVKDDNKFRNLLLLNDIYMKKYNNISNIEELENYYYSVRELNPDDLSDEDVASRFIFLNRTCFNGIYRVNKKGKYNTPWNHKLGTETGSKLPFRMIVDDNNLLEVHNYLKNHVDIYNTDYKDILDMCKKDDFIYIDSPYIPLNDPNKKCNDYTSNGFTEKDQKELSICAKKLNNSYVMLSNSCVPQIYELYEGFSIDKVLANRAINSNGSKRNKIEEVLIRNYI